MGLASSDTGMGMEGMEGLSLVTGAFLSCPTATARAPSAFRAFSKRLVIALNMGQILFVPVTRPFAVFIINSKVPWSLPLVIFLGGGGGGGRRLGASRCAERGDATEGC